MDETPREPGDVAAPSPISARRRALIKAGWVTPMIVAVSLPVSGFAANASGNVGSQDDTAGAGQLDNADLDRIANGDGQEGPSNPSLGSGNSDDPGRDDADAEAADAGASAGAIEGEDGENGSGAGRGRERRLKRGVRPKIHARAKGDEER